MELWNSVWNELCANVGRTTTKMDAHFVPQFFKFFAGSEHSQGPLGGPHACSTSRFSLSSFLRHGYNENIWRSKRCNVEHITHSADKIFCAKEIAAVYIQTFSKFLVFCPLNDNSVITLRRIFEPEL